MTNQLPQSPHPIPKSPVKFFQVRWNEPLGEAECPYARRWVINFGLFSVRIHRWYRSDDKRFFHDHAWPFITFVLWGGYTDVTPSTCDTLTTGSIRYRSAFHQHYVEVKPPGAVTLLITGPQTRNWGFWING